MPNLASRNQSGTEKAPRKFDQFDETGAAVAATPDAAMPPNRARLVSDTMPHPIMRHGRCQRASALLRRDHAAGDPATGIARRIALEVVGIGVPPQNSEEHRVGKEVVRKFRSGWSP